MKCKCAKLIYLVGMALMLSLSSYSIQPKRNYLQTMDSIQVGIQWKAFLIPAGNNIELNLWQIMPTVKNKNNDKLIIIAPGDQGNMSYYCKQAAALANGGFQVVMFDYRGFGNSSGYSFDEDYIYHDMFKDDLLTVLNWTAKRGQYKERGIFAFSMGTVITQMAILEQKVDFVIYDGFIINPVMISKRIKDLTNVSLQFPESAFDFERKMKKVKIPTLIFASDSDPVCTKEDAMRYSSQRKNRKYHIYNAGHLNSFQSLTKNSFGDELVDKLTGFLK